MVVIIASSMSGRTGSQSDRQLSGNSQADETSERSQVGYGWEVPTSHTSPTRQLAVRIVRTVGLEPVLKPQEEASPARRRRWRLPGAVTTTVVLATTVFALAGIGSPLLGMRVFADTGSLADYSGYRDALAGVHVQTEGVRDQVDSAMPNSMLFGDALRAGDFAGWNPYAMGGAPLASTPNFAIASPLSLPYWVLPGWLAPAYVKLLELICAIGGMYLFLRRLRLSRPRPCSAASSTPAAPSWSRGPAGRRLAWRRSSRHCSGRSSGSSADHGCARSFWSRCRWPACFSRLPGRDRIRLLTAAIYLLVRVAPRHRRRWRPAAGRIVAAGAGVAAGLGLAAWQLIPWVHYMSTVLVANRAQDPNQYVPPESLLTMIAPYAFGATNPAKPPTWFGGLALVDAEAYVGAAALVLVVTAIALARPARSVLPAASGGCWSAPRPPGSR